MAALAVVEPDTGSTDPFTGWLDDVVAQLGAAVADAGEVCDAARIDRIARLEQLRAVTAAAQAAECVRFAQSQVAEQLAQEVHPTSEPVAEHVVSETRHLDAATRRAVDAQIVAAGITGMGVRAAAACARQHAYQADPQASMERGRTERKHRRVTLRPAPDTMSMLSGYLPVEQGVDCLAALRKHTDGVVAAGDPRSRDQIMADTLVERLTGQTRAVDVNVEVHILLPLNALTDPNSRHTATLIGAGPLPGPLARDIITASRGRRRWQRLFTAPTGTDGETGPIIGGDPARRRFDGWLAQLIKLRDHTCRDPFCDAPIRHLDHIIRRADHGPTTQTNGRGVCARGNYTREMPGWHIDLIHHGHAEHPHTIQIRTPTGHTYLSRAPDPP